MFASRISFARLLQEVAAGRQSAGRFERMVPMTRDDLPGPALDSVGSQLFEMPVFEMPAIGMAARVRDNSRDMNSRDMDRTAMATELAMGRTVAPKVRTDVA
jgi:hypothetical protein